MTTKTSTKTKRKGRGRAYRSNLWIGHVCSLLANLEAKVALERSGCAHAALPYLTEAMPGAEEGGVDSLPQEVVGHSAVPVAAHESGAAQLFRGELTQNQVEHFVGQALEAD